MRKSHEKTHEREGSNMTIREELGFNITEILLDRHNEKLKTLKKKYMDLLENACELIPNDKKTKMTDLEDAFSGYVEAVKEEYYKASISVDTVVQENIKKEIKAQILETKADIVKEIITK